MVLCGNVIRLSCGTYFFDTEMMDLRYSGVHLTWCNKHENEDRMYAKLDRAIVNGFWYSMFENSEAIFLHLVVSEHSPCMVKLNMADQPIKHVFRFCDMWVQDENFLQLVREAWDEPVNGTPMYRLTHKMKKSKESP